MKNLKLLAALITLSGISYLSVSARCWTNRNGERVCDDRRHFRPVRDAANILTLGGVSRMEEDDYERSSQREEDIRRDERRRMQREDE